MNKVFAITTIALLCLGGMAQADVFNLGAGFTNLETVQVGDTRNAADTTGYGSVGYSYSIGKYEVTAAQYCDFLNAKAKTDTYGLYSTYMWSNAKGCKIQRSGSSGSYTYSVSSEYANRPVNNVSYADTCRFTNWLGNGQGAGSTEIGAYTLNGYNGFTGLIVRNTGWKWAVASEDEWYKAAYYKGGSINAGYWDYATQHDGVNYGSINTTMANYYSDAVQHTTDVGSYAYASAYGTFDQGGNVFERTESLVVNKYPYPVQRGGSFYSSFQELQATFRKTDEVQTIELDTMGFRVSTVPEPSSILALLGGLGSLIAFRRRRA